MTNETNVMREASYKEHLDPRDRRHYILAMHCSGGTGANWKKLREVVGHDATVCSPDNYGTPDAGPWTGEHAFSIADEAARAIQWLDQCSLPVHVVGHSYGGAVAMHVALSRPDRVASLALYEPAAFSLLRQFGGHAHQGFFEICEIADRVAQLVRAGNYYGALQIFVDYWSGSGSWASLKPKVQAVLMKSAPKIPMEFQALLTESTQLGQYSALHCPVLIMRGERAQLPTRIIATQLSRWLPNACETCISDAGHMGPLTHGQRVMPAIEGFITQCAQRTVLGAFEPERLAA